MSIIKIIVKWLIVCIVFIYVVGFINRIILNSSDRYLFYKVKKNPNATLVAKALWRAETPEHVALLNEIIINNTNSIFFSRVGGSIKNMIYFSRNTNYLPCVVEIALQNNLNDFNRRRDALEIMEWLVDHRYDTNAVAIVKEIAGRTNDILSVYAWIYLSNKGYKGFEGEPPQLRNAESITPYIVGSNRSANILSETK